MLRADVINQPPCWPLTPACATCQLPHLPHLTATGCCARPSSPLPAPMMIIHRTTSPRSDHSALDPCHTTYTLLDCNTPRTHAGPSHLLISHLVLLHQPMQNPSQHHHEHDNTLVSVSLCRFCARPASRGGESHSPARRCVPPLPHIAPSHPHNMLRTPQTCQRLRPQCPRRCAEPMRSS